MCALSAQKELVAVGSWAMQDWGTHRQYLMRSEAGGNRQLEETSRSGLERVWICGENLACSDYLSACSWQLEIYDMIGQAISSSRRAGGEVRAAQAAVTFHQA